jgi:hypothetical protein
MNPLEIAGLVLAVYVIIILCLTFYLTTPDRHPGNVEEVFRPFSPSESHPHPTHLTGLDDDNYQRPPLSREQQAHDTGLMAELTHQKRARQQ